MKQIIPEQIDWDAASKEAAAPQTSTKTTVTKPKSGGGTTSKGGGTTSKGGGETKNKDIISKGGGESAADKLKKPETRVVAEADTIQRYIQAAYVAFAKIGPMTTNINLDEDAIHQALINYLPKTADARHIALKAQYLDFIIRISNPNSSLSSFIKQNFAAWNYVIKGKKGLTIQAIRAVPCLPSLRTFNDFVNPKSQLGNWLDAHDFSNSYVSKLIRTLLKASAITITESNNEITQTKFVKSISSTTWNKKVLTLYKNKAYG